MYRIFLLVDKVLLQQEDSTVVQMEALPTLVVVVVLLMFALEVQVNQTVLSLLVAVAVAAVLVVKDQWVLQV